MSWRQGETFAALLLYGGLEMKSVSIDIESFSDVDLNKCGVYKYCESNNFEILLFA